MVAFEVAHQSATRPDRRREGVELAGPREADAHLVEAAAGAEQVHRVPLVCRGVLLAHRQGGPVVALGALPVVIVVGAHRRARGEGLGRVRIELECPLHVRTRGGEELRRRADAVDRESEPRVGEPGVREGESGVQLHRLLEVLERAAKGRLGALVPLEASLQVRLVRLHARGGRLDEALPPPEDRRREGRDDRAADLILHVEHVGELAIEPLGPEGEAVLAVHEVGGDAHARAAPAHAPGEHGGDAELGGDLLHVAFGALEREG